MVTISGRFSKCGSMHTLTAIAHNPLCFGGGFGSDLQTQIKSVKKLQTNIAHNIFFQQLIARFGGGFGSEQETQIKNLKTTKMVDVHDRFRESICLSD